MTGTDVTDDGKLLAYDLAMAGSDWQEWKVRDIESGKDLDDHIKWIKFSGASWKRDGSGFFYSRYDEPTEDQLKAANPFAALGRVRVLQWTIWIRHFRAVIIVHLVALRRFGVFERARLLGEDNGTADNEDTSGDERQSFHVRTYARSR